MALKRSSSTSNKNQFLTLYDSCVFFLYSGSKLVFQHIIYVFSQLYFMFQLFTCCKTSNKTVIYFIFLFTGILNHSFKGMDPKKWEQSVHKKVAHFSCLVHWKMLRIKIAFCDILQVKRKWQVIRTCTVWNNSSFGTFFPLLSDYAKFWSPKSFTHNKFRVQRKKTPEIRKEKIKKKLGEKV